MYGFFLAGAVILLRRTDRVATILGGLTLVAIAATRPEGLVIAPAMAFAAMLRGGRSSGRLAVLTTSLGGDVAIELFRLIYYGRLEPMSVVAKSDQSASILQQLRYHGRAGLHYIELVLSEPGLVLIAAAIVVGVTSVTLDRSAASRADPAIWTATAACAGGFGLVLFTGGDWMPNGRLLMPYFPLMVVAVIGLALRSNVNYALLGGALLALMLAAVEPHSTVMRESRSVISTGNAFMNPGRSLEDAGLGDRYVATDVLGRVPYYAPSVRFTDVFGLTEPAVAESHEDGSVFGKMNFPVTASRHPVAVVSNGWPTIKQLMALSRQGDFEAIVGPRMADADLFVVVERPFLTRVLADVRRLIDASATNESVSVALRTWQGKFPHGQ